MSNAHRKDFILTEYAKNLIEFKARQLLLRQDFSQSERKEIEQELWLAVVSQADRFDPARASLDTFIDRVVNTAVAIVLRDRQRQKRGNGYHTVSLDAAPADGRSNQPLAAQVSEADLRRRTGATADDASSSEGKEAVSSALAAMPPKISDVCRRVMGGSISSAARELNTSRRQIRKSLAAARPYVKRAGIDPK